MKYIFLLSCLLINCTNKNILIEFEKFPKEMVLNSKEIIAPDIFFMTSDMVVSDSFLIALDIKSDKFFHVFKLPEFNYLGGFIGRGNGPGEEFMIMPFFMILKDNNFMYQTINSVKIVKFNYLENKIEIIKKINLPDELLDLMASFMLNDCIYGYVYYRESNNEFLEYNTKNNNVSDFGPEFPEVEREIPLEKRLILFNKITTVKPDKSLFASVYDKFPIMRIYSKEGSLIKETRYKNRQIFPKALIETNPLESDKKKIMQNYRNIKSTNKYIYALYLGKTSEEIDKGGESADEFSNEIHVWDWEGNPIAKIVLDQKIFSCSISPDDSFIIATSMNYQNKLFKYSLDALI